MAEFIQCRWCEHCDTNRKNGDKVRCKRYSQWVDPCGYGIRGCKNYDYYQREQSFLDRHFQSWANAGKAGAK